MLTRSSVQHSHQVLYFLTSQLSTNHPTSLCHSEHFTIPTQYLFFIMSTSTHTRSISTTSTETTTLSIYTYESSYVTQTDHAIIITDLFSKLYDKFCKLYDKLMESQKKVTATITDKDVNFEKKTEKRYIPYHSTSKRIY